MNKLLLLVIALFFTFVNPTALKAYPAFSPRGEIVDLLVPPSGVQRVYTLENRTSPTYGYGLYFAAYNLNNGGIIREYQLADYTHHARLSIDQNTNVLVVYKVNNWNNNPNPTLVAAKYHHTNLSTLTIPHSFFPNHYDIHLDYLVRGRPDEQFERNRQYIAVRSRYPTASSPLATRVFEYRDLGQNNLENTLLFQSNSALPVEMITRDVKKMGIRLRNPQKPTELKIFGFTYRLTGDSWTQTSNCSKSMTLSIPAHLSSTFVNAPQFTTLKRPVTVIPTDSGASCDFHEDQTFIAGISFQTGGNSLCLLGFRGNKSNVRCQSLASLNPSSYPFTYQLTNGREFKLSAAIGFQNTASLQSYRAVIETTDNQTQERFNHGITWTEFQAQLNPQIDTDFFERSDLQGPFDLKFQKSFRTPWGAPGAETLFSGIFKVDALGVSAPTNNFGYFPIIYAQ